MRRRPGDMRPILLLLTLTTALSACAPHVGRIASAPDQATTWPMDRSDIPVDPGFRFGELANGMRFVIRHNATPKGTALVRMEVHAGSLDESESERGFAHFVEHMAFNGSTHVPEGEMVRLLERKGLAFGADTNAQTSFEQTTYLLDLPRADPALLDTALMLMRETASELKFSPAAVARERGVVLSEMRDRNSWQQRNTEDQLKFLSPAARYVNRLPIGLKDRLDAATSDSLRAFWAREYVPAHVTVVVVGDFVDDQVEAAIRARFADWAPAPVEAPPHGGPIDPAAHGRTAIYLDPALPERVAASRHGPWLNEPDSITQRRENLLRQIGYAIVNRRLMRATRAIDPPFRGAGFGTGKQFRDGRTTNLIVDTVDGKWRRGLVAVVAEYKRALSQGFTIGEVAEQVAAIRAAAQDAAASANTRSNNALVNAALMLLRDDQIPTTPESSLVRLEAFLPSVTPARVLAALKREAVRLNDPLLRFTGKIAPIGGEAALRTSWNTAIRAPYGRAASNAASVFAYGASQLPGQIVSDVREAALGIRQLRFANGVRLNLKHTDLEVGRIALQVSLDGGEMLDTRDNPLATEMAQMLPAGGLGKHSQDDLQSLLAGRTVDSNLSATPETFVATSQTTPRDLELALQLIAATITDPGYRPEGEARYRLNINTFFSQMRATPGSALNVAQGGILSDQDPRFSMQDPDAYRNLTYAKLKADLGDRLAHGAIEIGLVGDFDEAQAVATVARSFGALPPREAEFRGYPEQRTRPFTTDRRMRTVTHTGAADQAIVRAVWPTRDGSDPVVALQLALLERVVQIELTENLREKLGKSYSPGASSDASRVWNGYGTFTVTASINLADLAITRAALTETIAELRNMPVSADTLLRARAPLLESYDNALKTNRGWMTLVDRAQTEADRIERFQRAKERLSAITAQDLQAVVRQYLIPSGAVEIDVVPEATATKR